MPYATAVDGARIYYEVTGAGEPLLLISGQAGDHRDWDTMRPDFADRFRTYSFDHRGTGRSDKPTAPYSTRLFAADAIAVLDAAGISRAHAYGTSMGGRIGQWLGAEHADRLGALVLGCTTPGDAHGIARTAEDNVTFRAEPTAANAVSKLLLSYTQAWIDAHPELVAEFADPPPDLMPPFARELHYLASQQHDAWAVLPAIDVPTLVIHGGADPVNPTANAYLLAERIPGATLHIVPDGRHSYGTEFRAEASRVVLDFLSRHPLS
jgi:pimeloyl-ACP methyl ester carboxylesterase